MSFLQGRPEPQVGDHGAPADDPPPRTSDAFEVVGVFLLILIHIWWVARYVRPAWLAIVVLVAFTHWRRRESLGRLGFRGKNFLKCLRDFAPLMVGLAGVPIILGVVFGSLRPPPRQLSVPLFVTYYCVWGLFQQYALNGYFVNRLRAAASEREERWVPLLAATLFGAVHVPNWFLVSVTFTLGLLCARIYLTYRNLFFLGLAHGVIASALYMTVPEWMSLRFYIGPRAMHF